MTPSTLVTDSTFKIIQSNLMFQDHHQQAWFDVSKYLSAVRWSVATDIQSHINLISEDNA